MQIPSIQPINTGAIQSISSPTSTGAADKTDSTGKSFGQLLDSLNQSQSTSDNLMQQLANGEDVDLHQVMMASETNDINFRVAMSIRDKLVSAYQEVMRMNV